MKRSKEPAGVATLAGDAERLRVELAVADVAVAQAGVGSVEAPAVGDAAARMSQVCIVAAVIERYLITTTRVAVARFPLGSSRSRSRCPRSTPVSVASTAQTAFCAVATAVLLLVQVKASPE